MTTGSGFLNIFKEPMGIYVFTLISSFELVEDRLSIFFS
jgi:hypothetical protein